LHGDAIVERATKICHPARLFLLLVLAACLGGCDDKTPPPPAAAKPQVGVVTIHAAPVSITTDLPGRVTAFRVADVRPQVAGVILKRLFVEGSDVKENQVLYQIDPAPYEASLASAQASVAKAEAGVVSDQLTYDRYKPLAQAQAISRQDLDSALATLRQAQADVASGRASVKTAAINLAYTKVTSPIAGHTGRSSVTEGALVTANQTTSMVTVTLLNPIFVDVTQPSATLLRFKRELVSGQIKTTADNAAPVKLILEDDSSYDQPGKLQFAEVSVDQGTGSVTLRAIFPNDKGLLLPGMFVRETIDEGIRQNGLLVPQRGVTHDLKGDAVALVVDPDGKVAQRVVVIDRAVGNDWLVSQGLKDGDRVIVDGVQKVHPGVEVSVVEASPQVGQQAAGQVGQQAAGQVGQQAAGQDGQQAAGQDGQQAASNETTR
jgi:membrane fusion protein (multidrug efflux system)